MNYPSFIRITRPANSFAIGLLVLASCLIAGANAFPAIALAVVGSVLIAAGGYVLNDICDYEIDRIIHKERVLPRGEISQRAAWMLALLLLIGSPLLFLFVNRLSFVNAALAAFVLFLYSWVLKGRSGVLGNLATALLASNAALLGGFVTGGISNVVPLSICVFFATLAREIAKDIEDLPGDRSTRAHTVPMLIGYKKAAWAAALFLCVAILTSYLPYQQAIYGRAYFLAASTINVIVLYTAVRLAFHGHRGISLTQRLIKVEMFLYILVFLLATLFRTVQNVWFL